MVTNTATDDQPDLRHYLDALRRNWRVPPIAAIVLAALFAALPATSSPDRSTATVALVDESGIAAGLGLPKEMGTKYSSVGALLAMVRGDDVKQAVAAKLGYSPTVVITSEETPATITISADAKGAERATAAVDTYVNELIGRRRQLRTDTIGAALAANQERRDAIQARLGTVDKTLTAITDPASALTAGILTEREHLLTDLTDVDNTTAGFHQLERLSDGGIARIASRRQDASSGSRSKRAVYGLLLGFVLGAAGVVVAAFLDRRVRHRGDVERLAGAGSLLAVTARRPRTDDDILALAAAIAARAKGHDAVVLVPATRSVDTSALLSRLRASADRTIPFGVPPLAAVGNVSEVGLDGGQVGSVVVVAEAGRTRDDELALALDRLHNADRRVLGVVLTGVPSHRLGSAVL